MEEIKGVFRSELTKNFKQIKETRAESVTEDTEIIYKRKIEDLCHKIRNFDRDRDNLMNDLLPSNSFSTMPVPSDFKPEAFLDKDIAIGLNKRDAIIELEIVLDRYEYYFGPISDTTAILRVLPNWKSKFTE